MAARLWGHAWEIRAGLVLLSFGLLEDAAFRRKRHPTLSRRLKRLLGRFALAACAAAGIALGVHLARLEADQWAGTNERKRS